MFDPRLAWIMVFNGVCVGISTWLEVLAWGGMPRRIKVRGEQAKLLPLGLLTPN
jgi:hypothetical protein